jgi:hypothetical protein
MQTARADKHHAAGRRITAAIAGRADSLVDAPGDQHEQDKHECKQKRQLPVGQHEG